MGGGYVFYGKLSIHRPIGCPGFIGRASFGGAGFRNFKCSNIYRITPPSLMTAMTPTSAPHSGQLNGSASYTRQISFANAARAALVGVTTDSCAGQGLPRQCRAMIHAAVAEHHTEALRAAEIETVMAWLPPPPATILEIGGGNGHSALLLSERGYTVRSIDVAPWPYLHPPPL